MDGGAWWATVHRVAKSRTRLSDFTSLRVLYIHWLIKSSYEPCDKGIMNASFS